MTEDSAYRKAGVDIDAKYAAVRGSEDSIRDTYTPGVLGDVGLFGGLFDPAAVGAEGQLLVASTDGVGTKVMVAQPSARISSSASSSITSTMSSTVITPTSRPLSSVTAAETRLY